MKTLAKILSVVAAVILVFNASPALAFQINSDFPERSEESRHVYVLDAPYLNWSDINADTMPSLYSVLDESGVANLISRSYSRGYDTVPTADEITVSMNSGKWMDTLQDLKVTSNDDANSSDNLIGSETISYTPRENSTLDGWIGSILAESGYDVGAVGCSDYNGIEVRPAATLLANTSSQVTHSYTDASTLMTKTFDWMPFAGTDYELMWQKMDELEMMMPGNAVIAIDTGDLYRAGTYKLANPGADANMAWGYAVACFDLVVEGVLDRMGPSDVLVVYASQTYTSSTDGADDGYGPLVIYGGGYNGALTSDTTNTLGMVIALDLINTILTMCGAPNRVDNSAPITNVDDGVSVADTVYHLTYEANLADAICDGQVPMNILLCSLLGFAFLCSFLMLSPRIRLHYSALDPFIKITRALWLIAAAFPVSTYLEILLLPFNVSAQTAVFTCVCITFVLVGIAILIAKLSKRWIYSLLFLMALTIVVIIGDQLTGGNLARIGFLTYQPVRLGRFNGIGNEGAAVLMGSWLMLSGLLLNRFTELRIAQVFRKWLFLLLSTCILAVVIAPWWGANFGVLVWGVIAVGASWWMFIGRRLTWKVVLLTMAACVGLVLVLIMADGLIGDSSHLGATAQNLAKEGIAYVPTILGNMFKLSFATLTYCIPLSVVLAVVWLYLAWLRIRKPGPYAVFWQRNYYFKATFTASMIAAVVMLLVEDSGILLPALILIYAMSGLVWLICDLHRWELRKIQSDLGLMKDSVETPVGGFKIIEHQNDSKETP